MEKAYYITTFLEKVKSFRKKRGTCDSCLLAFVQVRWVPCSGLQVDPREVDCPQDFAATQEIGGVDSL